MSEPMRLKVDLCERIGLCPGIKRGFKVLFRTLLIAIVTGRRVYYKNPPHEAMVMIRKTLEKGVPVVEWHPGLSTRAIQYILPFGGPMEAYEGPNADGTCPNVENIRNLAIRWHERGYRVIFVAEPDSSETRFINTFIGNTGATVSNFEEADALVLDPGDRVAILGQSSFRRDLFRGIAEVIKKRFPDNEIRVIAALCPEIGKRIDEVKHRVFTAHGKGVVIFENWDAVAAAFPYDAVVMVGGTDSKQMNYFACELGPFIRNVVWVKDENGLGAEQFKSGQRILVASGTDTMMGTVKRVWRRLRRLRSDQPVLERQDPDLCGGCTLKATCPRRGCTECEC